MGGGGGGEGKKTEHKRGQSTHCELKWTLGVHFQKDVTIHTEGACIKVAYSSLQESRKQESRCKIISSTREMKPACIVTACNDCAKI